jgi:hypothetical protein
MEAQWGTPPDPLIAAQRQADFNRTQKGFDMDWMLNWAKSKGMSEQDKEELKNHLVGLPATAKFPKPLAGEAGKPFPGPDGQYYQKAQDPTTGAYIDIPMGPDWKPAPPKPSNSKYATDRAAYAASIGKKPEEMTWADTSKFEKEEWKNNNPLGNAKFALQREGLDFRESTGDLINYVRMTKIMQPLDRLVQVSDEAQQDVASPSGPGDVALTLAFFDAIKTQGVRFTKQENDLINNSRGFMESVQARYDAGFNGTAFGPAGSQQRQIIADIVKKGAEAAQKEKAGLQSSAGAFRPKVAAALAGNDGGTPAPKHKIKIGNKFYTYNGSGDTANLKNYTEVK